MPATAAGATTVYGAAYGLFPIGWIILNLIFLYQLTVKKGLFDVLRNSLGSFAPDPRIQVILIAFSFGAFFEGAAGFGTPVAVTAAILIHLGFKPLQASGLSLIANTAPVAFGALGTPVIALSGVTGLDLQKLSAMVGRQLPFFSLVVPFWVVWAFAGFRGMLGVWPAALTAGAAFAIPQFLVSNFHGPWLVDIVAAISSMAAVAVLLKFWQPRDKWRSVQDMVGSPAPLATTYSRSELARAWTPWVLLSLTVFLWGVPQVKKSLNQVSAPKFAVTGLHDVVVRTPPVVPTPTSDKPTKPEEAVFTLNWLSATGTGILVSAIVAGFIMGFGAKGIAQTYWETLVRVRFSLMTIAAMLALGYVTRYSGSDATLGLALAKTGSLYPFFGTLLGWLGVALTGSDTASNVLFGSLQTITAKQTGLNPLLMAAANSSGGVMGKMVDAQSIVVASTATNWYGHEDKILRYVFFHSLALAALAGILVYLQAYVAPFTGMVVK
jgi:lactate permease